MSKTGLGIIALFIWSFSILLLAWLNNIPTFEILSCAFLIGFVVMTTLQIYKGEDIKSYWRQPLSSYAFWLCGAGSYTVLLYAALKMAPVFEVNALNYLWPILLVIFSGAMRGEKPSSAVIVGGIAGFVGTALVMAPAHNALLFSDFQAGHALAVICAFIWASYSALTRKRPFPVGFLAPAFLIFSAICLVLHLTFEHTVLPNSFEILILFILGLTRISYVLWDQAMKEGDVALLASLSYFLPLVSTLWLMAFGFGAHRPLIALGGAFIIAGCLSVNAQRIWNLLPKKAAP